MPADREGVGAVDWIVLAVVALTAAAAAAFWWQHRACRRAAVRVQAAAFVARMTEARAAQAVRARAERAAAELREELERARAREWVLAEAGRIVDGALARERMRGDEW